MLSIESLLGWLPGTGTGGGPSLSADAQSAARRLIVDTLPRLDERRRLVLALRYYEELSEEEIARTLAMSLDEVRSIQQETVSLLEREIRRRVVPGSRTPEA